MTRSVEVVIDKVGNIRPVDASITLPNGHATLVWDSADHELYQASEQALADWLRPEEDEAWAYLQLVK